MIFIQTIFKVILNISEIKPSGQIHNPTIRIYIKKIGNKITLKIKKITAETMDLFESTKKIKIKVKMVKCSSFRNHWSSISLL